MSNCTQNIPNSPNSIPHKIKPKVDLAVLASGNGSNFQALVEATRSNKLEANIKLLLVNKSNCKAIERASKLGICWEFLDHRLYKSRKDYDLAIIEILEKYNIEAIVMAGWMRIVTDQLINKFPNKIINVHPSLLPSFKGMDAIKQALNSKVKITGCTVHIVEKEVDSGTILLQSPVVINENDNLISLKAKIQKEEHKILPLAIAIAAQKWR